MVQWLLRLMPPPLSRLFEGFWAVPLGLTVLGVTMALGLQWVDGKTILTTFGAVIPTVDVDGARMTLSAVAGGVLSIATLVFSLTFVALSITAQQLSPRVLDSVLRERTTQVLLGLALATFLFSAISLSSGEAAGAFRLAIASPVALVLAATTLTLVVVFSHAMTRVMRADDMVVRLSGEYISAVRRRLDLPPSCRVAAPDASGLTGPLQDGDPVTVDVSGYLGTIDYTGLLAFAERRTLLIEVLYPENSFVLRSQVVARTVGGALSDADRSKLQSLLNLTDRRVPGATAIYEASALSEAAMRALSPGINDPATAQACINQLFDGLVIMADAPPRALLLTGKDDVARILRAPHGLPEYLAATVFPIVECAKDEATRACLAARADTLISVATRADDRIAVADLLRRIEATPADSR